MPAHIPDETLMQSYRDGDLTSFKELYQRHSHGLYRFIAWRSPRREWVDEIVQDSWASLHKARDGYQPEASFKTYLYQIARNRLIDLLRQQQLVLASELESHNGHGNNDGGGGGGNGGGDDGGGWFEHLADHAQQAPSPETALEQKQQMASLHAAIRSLPGEQREVLILQQFNDMSLDEIATLTAAPVETVKSRLRYAMQKLRQQLQGVMVRGELV